MNTDVAAGDSIVVEDTRRWIQRAVIGLNLCPFAKAVEVKGLVHYTVSHSIGFKDLLEEIEAELQVLEATNDTVRDTTLFIVPDGLADFLEYIDFVAQANRMVAKMGWEGTFQIASLHPRYQFADSETNDITNFTNRSPYPTLHLLREASIDRAVKAFPYAETIFQFNQRTMERIGRDGWAALSVGATGSEPFTP